MKEIFEGVIAVVANFPSAAEIVALLALFASVFMAAGVFIGWLVWA